MILPGNAPESIAKCRYSIGTGGLIGLPTETVYGLGADADNAQAVARIFVAKGRPADHPLIVHVADGDLCADAVAHFAQEVPQFASDLMRAFWPGPLTLILPRREGVAAAAAGGQASIGLRCPKHPVAQALLRACLTPTNDPDPSPDGGTRQRAPVASQGRDSTQTGAPRVWGIAAPSANRFGRVSPTLAAHVHSEFGDDLPVLDGGPCDVGIESTIVDCTRGVPVLLRPGQVQRAQLERVLQQRVLDPHDAAAQRTGQTPRASGTLHAHYAPNAKVRLMDGDALQTALDMLGSDIDNAPATIAVYSRRVLRSRSSKVIRRRMPDDADAVAHQLFAVLREFDAQAVKLIWVETPPVEAQWDGVRDRLQRACAA